MGGPDVPLEKCQAKNCLRIGEMAQADVSVCCFHLLTSRLYRLCPINADTIARFDAPMRERFVLVEHL
jgi:hypothetical protein